MNHVAPSQLPTVRTLIVDVSMAVGAAVVGAAVVGDRVGRSVVGRSVGRLVGGRVGEFRQGWPWAATVMVASTSACRRRKIIVAGPFVFR